MGEYPKGSIDNLFGKDGDPTPLLTAFEAAERNSADDTELDAPVIVEVAEPVVNGHDIGYPV